MQVSQNGKENILPRKGICILFFKEREIVILIDVSHNTNLLVGGIPISHNGKIGRCKSSKGRKSRKDRPKLAIGLLEITIARVLSDNKVVLLKHKEWILEDFG